MVYFSLRGIVLETSQNTFNAARPPPTRTLVPRTHTHTHQRPHTPSSTPSNSQSGTLCFPLDVSLALLHTHTHTFSSQTNRTVLWRTNTLETHVSPAQITHTHTHTYIWKNTWVIPLPAESSHRGCCVRTILRGVRTRMKKQRESDLCAEYMKRRDIYGINIERTEK